MPLIVRMPMHGGKELRVGTTLGLWLIGNIGIFPVSQYACLTGKRGDSYLMRGCRLAYWFITPYFYWSV